jgi:flagellar biosynthesis regulator FlbT
MMIVEPHHAERHRARFRTLVDQLQDVFKKPEIAERLVQIRELVEAGQPYRALALLRAVLKYEDVLLSAVELAAASRAERKSHAKLAGGWPLPAQPVRARAR